LKVQGNVIDLPVDEVCLMELHCCWLCLFNNTYTCMVFPVFDGSCCEAVPSAVLAAAAATLW
jgi:hypothetical protein